jgi:hypothetical protein
MLQSAQSPCKSFRFARPRMQGGEQEKEANHREDKTASEEAHDSERGYDLFFTLLGLDPALEIGAQPTNGNARP